MKIASLLLLGLTIAHVSCTQTPDRKVGGGCEACDLIYEGMPTVLSWETTIPPAGEAGEPMVLNGTIFKKDGKTPAADIIYYVYHTDNNGLYSPSPGKGSGNRHGHLRGWVKTDGQGRYQFRTIKPKPYPNANIPAHVHPIIKEPGLTEYYIDEYLFDDDPFLTPTERARQEKRGGSGIIHLSRNQKGEWIGHRDVVLGLNVPGY